MTRNWKGAIIAEGLSDPTVINNLSVYKAHITKDNMEIDYEGNIGRWHIYHVKCSREEIDALQPYIIRGWYAHFWAQDDIIVVYNDRQFEVKKDRSTWKEAVDHGKAQGILENQLGFPTD